MYARACVAALAAGCVADPGAGALAGSLRGLADADPAWACLLEPGEAEAAEASVVEEFGWYSLSGGRAVWCDLPGTQANEAGREVFVPLTSARSWDACSWAPGGAACEALAEADVSPGLRPVTHACADGTRVPLGYAAEWTCEALGWGGDASRTVELEWSEPW